MQSLLRWWQAKQNFLPQLMVAASKVRQYKPAEINVHRLVAQAQELLGCEPFEWQLEVTKAILGGEDVIVDVGTGNGKSLCFSLPLLINKNDVNLVISPLTALMIDQVWG
jgi:superfamily II DNA helicase RecQ